MNAFRILNFLAAVAAVYCTSNPDPILTTNVAHGNKYNPLSISKVALNPVHHTPAVVVPHVTPVPLSHVTPVAVSHHAAIPALAVRHHGSPVLTVSHPVSKYHPVTRYHPVSKYHPVSHHAVAPVAVSRHHHAPALTLSHAPAAHIKPGGYIKHSIPTKSQYHSQDELGQYAFGYNDGTSTRDESRDAYGNVRGSYSYVDPYGDLKTQHYIADDYGFRVAGNNLPVHVKDSPLYRHKRSYATFPASTGPLTTVDHIGHVLHGHAPVAHKVSHVVHKPVHVVHKVAPSYGVTPVVHKVAPVIHKVAPVVHKIAPVVHKVAPVVHKIAPVVHKVAPSYGVAPVVHKVSPVVRGYSAPAAVGYAGSLPHGFPYHRSAYGSYGQPIIGHHY